MLLLIEIPPLSVCFAPTMIAYAGARAKVHSLRRLNQTTQDRRSVARAGAGKIKTVPLFPLTDRPPPRRLSVLYTLRFSLMTSEGRMEANLDNPGFSGLATDLYQLTMAAAYYANRRDVRASFELFTRRLPEGRSYLIVAGLEQAL